MVNFYEQIDSNKRKSWFLMIFFMLFVALIAWIFVMALAVPESEQIGILSFIGIVAILYALISFYSGSKLALVTTGAKEVPREGDFLELHRIVENLAITAGIPKPKVCVIDDHSPNAFATGRDPEHSAVAVTTGLLNILERRELEGVIAHELSHIRNYDIRFMMLVMMLVGFIAIIADIFQRSVFRGSRSSNRSNSKGGGAIVLIAIALSILSPIIAKLIQMAISRKREFLADASSAQLTRFPEGLATALKKITNDDTRMASAGTATAHLFIASPFSNEKQKSFFKDWFSTHPDPEERIAALMGAHEAL